MSGTCPGCDVSVLPGESFCEACGHPLGAGHCPSCGAVAIDADGYCGRCGLRQPVGRDHTEIEVAVGGFTMGGVSDRGLRHSRNEDAMALVRVADDVVVGVVSDGVSSSPRPDEASLIAVDTGSAVLAKELRDGTDPVEATGRAVAAAADAVAALATSDDDVPACTYVSAIVTPEHVTIGWVGDSRAYWLAGPASGGLTSDDAGDNHVLTAWLGADAGEVAAHIQIYAPEGPGVILVCSDGLWNYYPEADALARLVPDAASSPLTAAQTLVRHAIEAGGRDNITALVIPFPGEMHQ
jgi:serine/threonine protein phosphatase PrpC